MSSSANDMHILVVDDESGMCELISALVKELGHEVTCALSGGEAIELAKRQSFDVVITDLKLPDRNGIEVLEKIKSFDPDTVVIISTGYPSVETIKAAMEDGAYNYITKPFDIEDFSSVLKKAVVYRDFLLTNRVNLT